MWNIFSCPTPLSQLIQTKSQKMSEVTRCVTCFQLVHSALFASSEDVTRWNKIYKNVTRNFKKSLRITKYHKVFSLYHKVWQKFQVHSTQPIQMKSQEVPWNHKCLATFCVQHKTNVKLSNKFIYKFHISYFNSQNQY